MQKNIFIYYIIIGNTEFDLTTKTAQTHLLQKTVIMSKELDRYYINLDLK